MEKKTYVLWKLLKDTPYQQRWMIPICDGNKNKTSVVTDQLHEGGDHIVVTQRNWSNFLQQKICSSVNSTLYNSVPTQRLNIRSKMLLIKRLQLTKRKTNLVESVPKQKAKWKWREFSVFENSGVWLVSQSSCSSSVTLRSSRPLSATIYTQF